MAKSGFWLKGAQGKLAGATMYKDANGDTVMREVVAPKNPQTTSQMVQRIIMCTIMQAYSAMKKIADHSFENVASGAKSMQVFMKRNLDFARQKISEMQGQGVDFYSMYNFVPLGTKEFVPNQYLISTGSLPQVFSSFKTEGNLVNNLVVAAIKVNTYQGVCDALGAQRGDQVTFLTFSASDTVNSRFRYCRVILDPTNSDGSQAAMSSAFLDGNAINLPSVRNEGTGKFLFTIDANDGLGIKPVSEVAYAGGVILSRYLNDSWLRSTCRLTYKESVAAVTGRSLGECLDYALNGTPIYAPDRWYLNNAGQGNSAAYSAGQDAPTGGQGGSGEVTPTPGGGSEQSSFVAGVSVNGTSLVAGTTASLPNNQSGNVLVVTFNDASQHRVNIKTDGSDEAIWSGTDTTPLEIELTNPAATLNTIYKLYDEDGNYLNYSFRFTSNNHED